MNKKTELIKKIPDLELGELLFILKRLGNDYFKEEIRIIERFMDEQAKCTLEDCYINTEVFDAMQDNWLKINRKIRSSDSPLLL